MNSRLAYIFKCFALFFALHNNFLLAQQEVDIQKSKSWFLYNDDIENDPYALDLQRELFYLDFTTPHDNGEGVLRDDFRYPVVGLYPCGRIGEKMFDYFVARDSSLANASRFCKKNGYEDIFHGSVLLKQLCSPYVKHRDENGKYRQLHQYFNHPNFEWWGIARGVDKTAMDLWFFQAANFRYNYWKAEHDLVTYQTIEYTYRIKNGVCRDSALLLTDLLFYYGFDARYVEGYCLDERGPVGHAWVVLRHQESGNEYLLESTLETADMKMRVPPRTFCLDLLGYIPRLQATPNGYLQRRTGAWTPYYSNSEWESVSINE
jgi:hypothetical protein